MVKKIISKKITKAVSAPPIIDEEAVSSEQSVQAIPAKKRCVFCKNNTRPTYTDIAVLRRFVNDRSKIVPKLRTGVCSKHQRVVTEQIKYARHLALLPFTPKV